jgi:DNA sulfur modification protein DndE
MKISRIKITKDSTIKMRGIQGRTGLTPNILLRIGFGLSLRDKAIIDPDSYPEDGMEINRFTLTGEYDSGFVALLQTWLIRNNIPVSDAMMADYFRAHLNKGAALLNNKIKSLTDLAFLE